MKIVKVVLVWCFLNHTMCIVTIVRFQAVWVNTALGSYGVKCEQGTGHRSSEFILEQSLDQFSAVPTAPSQLLSIKGARCRRVEHAHVVESGTAA